MNFGIVKSGIYIFLTAFCTVALADPIDVVRIDLENQAVGLYGCQTNMEDGVLYAYCAGTVALQVGPIGQGAPVGFGAISPGYEHWAEDEACRLVSATVGATYGENRYEVDCRGIFRGGFEP